ncbi:MAG TPA: DUF6797 domain-containing protein [Humisphaera sp.]
MPLLRPRWFAPPLVAVLMLLPTLARGQSLELSDRGSYLINTLEAPDGNVTYKGVLVKLGPNDDAAVCFDTELMRMSVGWVRGQAAGEATPAWAGLIDPRNSTAFTAFHGGPPMVGVYSATKAPKGKPGPAKTAPAEMVRFATKPVPGWAVGADASFADPRTPPKQQPNVKLGPLPKNVAHWKGLYVNGDKVVFHYTVGATPVWESPALVGTGADVAFARHLHVGPSDKPMSLAVVDLDGADGAESPSGTGTYFLKKGKAAVGAHLAGRVPSGTSISTHSAGSSAARKPAIVLTIPPHAEPVVIRVLVWGGLADDIGKLAKLAGTTGEASVEDPLPLTKGGKPRWGDPITTAGKVGTGDGVYVVDTITPPEGNPFKSLVRFSGFDFFPDGKSAALCTIGGDVWVVSGIDEKLEKLTWRRYATGLFQALGLKIVDGKVYVLGRDGITRLHDLNGDGEADFYENFNNDTQVTTNYHEFCLDLQTDAAGNFYYPKGSPWPPDVKSDHQGVMFKVSKDGGTLEPIATGLRAPNGTGMGPGDLLTASDNQGHWEPACKVSWIRPGKFYGMVPAAHTADKSKPTTFEQPIFWLPMNRDNSSGGEAFVAGGKWGAPDGTMVHLSYGMSRIFLCPLQKVGDTLQGAAVSMEGLKFDSSCMRARFSATDGQLYLCGLKGWQTNAGRDGAFHRVRYTGKPVTLPVGFAVHANGIEITSGAPLDKAAAADAGGWAVEQWNYKWTGNYGSPEFSPKDESKKRHDEVEVKKVRVSDDGRTVFLEIDGLGKVDQMKITNKDLKDASGKPVKWEIFNTIQVTAPAK